MKKIFLDYASTTPMSQIAVDAMTPYYTKAFYNPSALYLAAKEVKKDIDLARSKVASLIGVRPSEIIFTAGTTEANNIVIRGVLEQYDGSHCVVSAIEHDSVLHTAESYSHSLLPVNEKGIIKVEELAKLVNKDTVLVCCMLANNELGTVQPIGEISKIISQIKFNRLKEGNTKPLYLLTDAAQAFNYMQVLPHSLGADFVVLSGSKTYGPKQTAALFVKAGIKLKSVITGGGQEWGVRAGTENIAGIMGLTAALEEAANLRADEAKRMSVLQDVFIKQLEVKLPAACINGSMTHRLPNNVHITIPNTDNETLIMQLDEAGIMAAAGSACSASSDEPSHVLTALGMSEKDIRSSLRFTMGRSTTETDIKKTVKILSNLTK